MKKKRASKYIVTTFDHYRAIRCLVKLLMRLDAISSHTGTKVLDFVRRKV